MNANACFDMFHFLIESEIIVIEKAARTERHPILTFWDVVVCFMLANPVCKPV